MIAKEFFFICTFMVAGLTAGMKLNIDSTLKIFPGQSVMIPVECQGAQGRVNIDVKGLPKGLILK